jgi:hypothetical protein
MVMPDLKHESAVIVVPRTGSLLDSFIAPGSGIVAVQGILGDLILYYEGNLFEAINLHEPEERIICSFGRAATAYPTTAFIGVLNSDVLDVIRVGMISWPNHISWDSPASHQRFVEYANRYQSKRIPSAQPALKFPKFLEINVDSFFPDYESPRELPEWRWIEAACTFENVQNEVNPETFEFVLQVRTMKEGDQYETDPPARVKALIDGAKQVGADWLMLRRG